MEDEIKCPKCQSTQISANHRGWNLLTGFIGSGKIVITCLKCGHKFNPGEDYDNTQKMKGWNDRVNENANKVKGLNTIIYVVIIIIVLFILTMCLFKPPIG